jgi:hypothetical protein
MSKSFQSFLTAVVASSLVVSCNQVPKPDSFPTAQEVSQPTETKVVESRVPVKLCERFAIEVSKFRNEINLINSKVNFSSKDSVIASFNKSGIDGSINLLSVPNMYTRQDGVNDMNSTSTFALNSGTKIQIDYYGKFI